MKDGKTFYGVLAGVILIIIGLILWVFPGWYSKIEDLSVMNYLYFLIIGTIFIAAGIVVIFFTGHYKGKRDHEGRAVSSLKIGEKYKVLGIIDNLGSSEEQTQLTLQEGDDKDNIINLDKNGCRFEKGIEVGSIITQDETDHIVLYSTYLLNISKRVFFIDKPII